MKKFNQAIFFCIFLFISTNVSAGGVNTEGIINYHAQEISGQNISMVNVSGIFTTESSANIHSDYHVNNYSGRNIDHNQSGDSIVKWSGGDSHFNIEINGNANFNVDTVLHQHNAEHINYANIVDGSYSGESSALGDVSVNENISGNVNGKIIKAEGNNNAVVWASTDGTTHGA